MLSYRYATRPDSSHTGYLETNVAAQQGYWRSGGSLTFRIPIPLRMWSATAAPNGDLPAFPLVRVYVGPRRNRTGDPIPAYHESAAKRRANRRLRRSQRTVEAAVMCSLNGVGRDL